MADSSVDGSPECRDCGDPVASSSEHRVVTALEDERATYRYFCNGDCLENWESDGNDRND